MMKPCEYKYARLMLLLTMNHKTLYSLGDLKTCHSSLRSLSNYDFAELVGSLVRDGSIRLAYTTSKVAYFWRD